MLVSNFELLIKRIAPRVLSNPNFIDTNAIARRAVQGYFLTISNQTNRRVYLKIRVVFSTDDPSDPTITTRNPGYLVANRELNPITGILAPNPIMGNNYLYAYDIAGGQATGSIQAGLLNGPIEIRSEINNFIVAKAGFITIKLERNQTGSFQLLPNVLDDTIRENANLEIRGYVEIFQSCVSEPQLSAGSGVTGSSTKLTGNYLTTNANVLLTAEQRGTILPNDFTPFFDPAINQIGDLDNYTYAIPLANPSGLYNLPPIMESMQYGRVVNPATGINDDFMTAYHTADEKQKIRMVLAVNEFLKANKIPIAPLKFTK